MTYNTTSRINIQHISPGELKAAEYNPRKHTERQKAELIKSIEGFGMVEPIIVNKAKNRKNIVIGGHFRLKVLRDLKHKTVPVVFVDIPDIKREKELNLRLNKNTGDWDAEMLRGFDPNFLIDVGFLPEELDQFWDEEIFLVDDTLEKGKEENTPPEPRIKPGEIYQLGRHQLMCGDSTDSDQIKKLLGDDLIDMVYCDPPYNIDLDYAGGVSGKKDFGGDVNDDLPEGQYRAFLKSTMQNAKAHCKKDAHVFYWCDQRYIGLTQSLYAELKIDSKRVCLWIKNTQMATPNIAFHKCYEPCVYGKIGSPYLSEKVTKTTEIMNPEVGNGNRGIDDILDLIDLWLVKRIPTSEYLHPTEKPVPLHEKSLRRCTKPGDTVLDLFGGSGSTLMACEQLGRASFLMEKNPIFCEVILRRWEDFTGKKAKKVSAYSTKK